MFIQKKTKNAGVSCLIALTHLVRFYFTFEPLEKIQDFNFLLKTHMKQVNESFLSIHAKFEPCRVSFTIFL
jgi:hypothetical protein